MHKLIPSLELGAHLQMVVAVIFGILIFSSVLFSILKKVKPGTLVDELLLRLKSWWVICFVFLFAALAGPLSTCIGLGILSFFALRELYTHLKLRESDRSILLVCYLCIPVQYYFAYKGWYNLFMSFIPVFMFISIPFLLVMTGDTKDIVRSMGLMPSSLMLGIFGISHMAMLVCHPGLNEDADVGKGLLLFLIFLTQINDVMQFTFGKLFGKHKIMPKVSPNKTWEGFIGGLVGTTVIGYYMGFLTPLHSWQLVLVSFTVALFGFIGDAIVSAIKRDFGVKDMGDSIPGHGGYLDRIDSLTTSASPFFHIVYIMILI
jgi:phosphatidate cytidylyltransferase